MPSIHFDPLTGQLITIPDAPTFIWDQQIPAALWTITHNLNGYPAIAVVDSAGDVVIGDVVYVSRSTITVSFAGAFSGTAYLR